MKGSYRGSFSVKGSASFSAYVKSTSKVTSTSTQILVKGANRGGAPITSLSLEDAADQLTKFSTNANEGTTIGY